MLNFVAELNMLPILVLACKMCPKNIEATMYAMLMASMNFGKEKIFLILKVKCWVVNWEIYFCLF